MNVMALVRRLARPLSRPAGFTLLEILIAMTIIMIGMIGVISLFSIGLHRTRGVTETNF